ncbi:MAG: ATP-binding protein [Lachnospiraceae bacterium]|nr:ATP-binding protein [Ruminococcus sp.]MCM1276434.1 ATP-binding protein [Lachnospiraceae bacterium]
MVVYKEKKLEQYVNGICKDYKERYLLEDLHKYMTSEKSTKVCCLYGLRRTGKSVMMAQEIKRLNDYSGCVYVLCEDGDRMWDVRAEIDRVLEKNPKCKNVFIDEATKAERFIDTCSYFADGYAARGIKVVLSGTDSLGFFIASGKELFDRVTFLHTTFIPFKEYNHVLGKGINDYIEYGGTLTDGEENVFYNSDRANFYTNAAIVENIVHTLERWDHGRNYAYDVLRDIVEHHDLPSFINKVIEYHNRRFLSEIINKDFISHDLHSLIDLMYKHQDRFSDPKPLETEEMNDRVRIALGIKENHFSKADESSVGAIVDYLKRMDVLYQIPKVKSLDMTKEDEYIFTQVGMRYCQATALSEALVDSGVFGEFNEAEQREILRTLKSDIKGGILEDIVFYQLSKDLLLPGERNDYAVTKYRDTQNREIDVLVLDHEQKTVLALEVKLSEVKDEGQRKHLLNDEVCGEIEAKTGMKIANKAVVYLGKCGESDDGVLYINAEHLLRNSREMIQALLRNANLSKFSQLNLE